MRTVPWWVMAAVLVASAGLFAVVWIPTHRTRHPDPAPKVTNPKPTTAEAPDPAPPAATKPVKRITAEQRAQLAAQFARAREARTAAAASRGTPPPPPGLVAEDVAASYKPAIKDAMHQVHEQLLACYTTALPRLVKKDFTIEAKLRMTGDPDVGMLIDADALADETGQPLPAELDDCLRSTFQQLELPPLGDGERLDVTYPFMFTHGD